MNSALALETDTLSPENMGALQALETELGPVTSSPISLGERIVDSFGVAQAYTLQIEDPTFRRNAEEKLVRSNVRGSVVFGINGPDDVVKMLASVTGWKEVVANLKDKEIQVFQGDLPKSYKAHAAYATMREIGRKYKHRGMQSIMASIGYQKADEYYLSTIQKFPTSVLTVQLKKDASGVEHLHQWFAGIENTSRVHNDDGDNLVRCGVVLQAEDDTDSKSSMPKGGHGKNRTHSHRAS